MLDPGSTVAFDFADFLDPFGPFWTIHLEGVSEFKPFNGVVTAAWDPES